MAIDMRAYKAAVESIYAQMQHKSCSATSWSEHELHPTDRDEATVAFIFTMYLLNFSFWSELPEDERFAVEYRGRQWTGYWILVASLQRALDQGIPTIGKARTTATSNPCGTSSGLAQTRECLCSKSAWPA